MVLKNEIVTAEACSILSRWLETKAGGEHTVRVSGFSTSLIGNRQQEIRRCLC